jgi:hypothetical protein
MKRSQPLRRTGFKRRQRADAPVVEREPHPMAVIGIPTSIPSLHRGTYGGSTAGPAPKTEPYRDAVLLEMARGRPCLLCPAGECTCTPGSTVACHSNLSIHGKAKNRKPDDCYTVWGGREAHARLDQPIGHDGPTREQKAATFMAAHLKQVLAWREIAHDPAEPERFRRAAQRALQRLNATPLPEVP